MLFGQHPLHFAEGLHDEVALQHAGMGDGEAVAGDDFFVIHAEVSEKEDVDVYGAVGMLAVVRFLRAAEAALYVLRHGKEAGRGKRCAEGGHGIEEAVGRGHIHGSRVDERGHGEHGADLVSQESEGGAKVGGAVAEVGAEGEEKETPSNSPEGGRTAFWVLLRLEFSSLKKRSAMRAIHRS